MGFPALIRDSRSEGKSRSYRMTLGEEGASMILCRPRMGRQ